VAVRAERSSAAVTPTGVAARIKIDLDRRLGQVDRRIYGGFVENLARCVYGGILDEGSPLSDEEGFRLDVVEAVRALAPPVMRWGGNFISGYHWLDGIGPRDQRPLTWDRAWRTEESNRFGPDEFIRFCRLVGAEPFICVNMGTGTLDEATAWVEYCNATHGTRWAELRRRNGHQEPHRVRYWGLGNEMYGAWQIGALPAADYAWRAREYAKAMKRLDPDIELVGCGENGWSEWDRVVLDGLAPYVTWHSLHLYTGSEDYWRNVFMPHQAERAIRTCRTLIERARYLQSVEHEIHIAFDEWNQWFRYRIKPDHEERYSLSDALAVTTWLNIFIRNCDIVRMANLAQMVNVIAPVVTNREGLFLQTIYHPLRLYSEHMQGTALDVHVDSPVRDVTDEETGGAGHKVADLGPFGLLDAVATCRDDQHELVLAVNNRDPKMAIKTWIGLTGTDARLARVYEVNGPSADSMNSFEEPDKVSVQERAADGVGDTFVYEFPAHSLTLLRFVLGAGGVEGTTQRIPGSGGDDRENK